LHRLLKQSIPAHCIPKCLTNYLRVLSDNLRQELAFLVRDLGALNMSIFTILFVVLVVAWLLGFTMFHVASGLIHILLILAVISLILHFVRGTSRAV